MNLQGNMLSARALLENPVMKEFLTNRVTEITEEWARISIERGSLKMSDEVFVDNCKALAGNFYALHKLEKSINDHVRMYEDAETTEKHRTRHE